MKSRDEPTTNFSIFAYPITISKFVTRSDTSESANPIYRKSADPMTFDSHYVMQCFIDYEDRIGGLPDFPIKLNIGDQQLQIPNPVH